jgi:hypothetical protein
MSVKPTNSTTPENNPGTKAKPPKRPQRNQKPTLNQESAGDPRHAKIKPMKSAAHITHISNAKTPHALATFFLNILLIAILSAALGISQAHAATYYTSGTIESTNLLSGNGVSSVNAFGYNLSSLPTDTSVQIRFSEDATNWYDSAGTPDAWDTLAEGDYTAENDALDLSALGWTRNYLYYQTQFDTTDTANTAVLDQVTVYYTPGPSTETSTPTNPTPLRVTANGEITALEGGNATERGFEYGLTETATWSTSETGSFEAETYSLGITGLNPNTTYYIRAFATNPESTGYGQWQSFTTGEYYGSGTLTSINLLEGEAVETINRLHYDLSEKPTGTTATIQFSQDGSTWYNSSGALDGTDTLEKGQNSINLYELDWTGANFYYQIEFTKNSSDDTPVLETISVAVNDPYNEWGPVGYWSFDQGVGTEAHNEGWGDGDFDGSVVGAAWTLDGKFGKALEFDGTDDYLDVGDFSVPVKTLSLWIKPTSDSEYIVDLNGTAYVYTSEGTVVAEGFSSASVYVDGVLGGTVAAGEWSNVVITTDTAITASDFDVGRVEGSGYFGGVVDEVKVFTYALSEDEVKMELNRGTDVQMGASGVDASGAPDYSGNAQYCVPGDDSYCAPPVGEWLFEEGSGTTAYDTSGNENDGSLVNSPGWATGKHGKALEFDGVGEYVEIGDHSSWDNLNGKNLTACAWVRTNYSSTRVAVVSKYATLGAHVPTPNQHWSLNTREGFLEADFRRDDYAETLRVLGTTSIDDSNWHYGCFMKNGLNLSIWVDGEKEDENDLSQEGNTDNNQPLRIGVMHGSFFPGLIDNVRIYDYARTPAQIAWEYNRGAPVGHWEFDQGEGITAYDSSGNDNHGTLTNMTSDDWVTGKINGALEFDGTDDYVDIGSLNGDLHAIAFWINTSSEDNNFMDLNGSAYITSTGGTISTTGLTSPTIYVNGTESSSFDTGAWQHIMIKTDTAISATDLDLGRIEGVGFFTGQMEDIRLYNYVPTNAQIKQIYNKGASLRFE